MPITRRPVDHDAILLEPGAEVVDIVDLVSQMAEIAAAGVILGIPIIREFEARRLFFPGHSNVITRSKKNQSESAFFVFDSAYFLETHEVAIEFH